MPKTLFAGIDVSGKRNTVCLMDDEGNMLEKVFNIQNNYPGACLLESHLMAVMENPPTHSSNNAIGTKATL